MFNIFKRVDKVASCVDEHQRLFILLAEVDRDIAIKLKALEDHLGIDYFGGDKQKPHYRKKKVVIKKLGRPRKIKNHEKTHQL